MRSTDPFARVAATVIGIVLTATSCQAGDVPNALQSHPQRVALHATRAECYSGVCFIDVEVTNKAKAPVDLTDWQALDTSGRIYAPEADGEDQATGTLNPGLTAAAMLAFDMPADASIAKVIAVVDGEQQPLTLHAHNVQTTGPSDNPQPQDGSSSAGDTQPSPETSAATAPEQPAEGATERQDTDPATTKPPASDVTGGFG